MTDTRNKSCEDRVADELASTIADLTDIQDRMTAATDSNDDDAYDEAQEEFDNFALGLDLRSTMVVQMSTGGPGDQFEIAVVNHGHGWLLDADEATYRFLDWFDGATRTTSDVAVMAYLENMVERLSY